MGIKITDLTALATAPNTADVIAIVDVSDTTQALSGTTKKITIADLGFLSSGDNITELVNNAGYITSSDFSNGGELALANRDLGNTDAFALSFITNGIGRINIEAGGNVGIGTTTPTEKLDVIGSAQFSNKASVGDVLSADYTFHVSGTTRMQSKLGFGSGSSAATEIGKITYGSNELSVTANNANNLQSNVNTGYFSWFQSANERMRLTNAGNLGIGTSTPTEKLQVTGNSYTTGQGSFGTAINPNAHLQVTASGKIVGIAGTSNAITTNNSAAIKGTASSAAAVEIYGVDGSAQGTFAGTQNTAVRGNAITAGGSNNYGGKFTGNNGSSQNIGIKGTTGNGSTGTVIRGVFGESLHQGAADAYGGYFSATGTKTGENIGLFATATGATTNYAIKSDGNVNMANLPTSFAGLSAGDLWNNAGVINIV